MNRTWLIFEKIFAVIQALLACLFIAFDYDFLIEDGERVADRGYPTLKLAEVVYNIQTWILPVLFLVAGTLLLLNKRLGWILSISLYLTFVIYLLMSEVRYDSGSNWYQTLLLFILCISPIAFLAQKPFLTKYHIGKKQWLFVGILVIAISLTSYWQRIF